MNIPKSLEISPIVEVVLEFRFESVTPSELTAGALWAKLPEEEKRSLKFERLPIADLPKQIAEITPNWKIMPHFQFISEKTTILIGMNVICFSLRNKYVGWNDFYAKCKGYLDAFIGLGVTNKFNRVALRYINFIEDDIFKLGNYSIYCNNSKIQSDSESIRFRKFGKNNDIVVVSVMNDATITSSGNTAIVGKKGSIIDIDSSCAGIFMQEDLPSVLGIIHDSSKQSFFEIIGDDLLSSFKPNRE